MLYNQKKIAKSIYYTVYILPLDKFSKYLQLNVKSVRNHQNILAMPLSALLGKLYSSLLWNSNN